MSGYALQVAQWASKHPDAKPLKEFRGASVLELVDHYNGDTYRAVYTVRFANAIYVLDACQKKSTKGIKTPKKDIDLVKQRLKMYWFSENIKPSASIVIRQKDILVT